MEASGASSAGRSESSELTMSRVDGRGHAVAEGAERRSALAAVQVDEHDDGDEPDREGRQPEEAEEEDFEGEQHGFRRSANIRRALDSELQFYGSVFGFEPPMPEDHEDLPMGERVVVPLAVEEEAPAS